MEFTLTPLSQLDPAGLEHLAGLHRSVMHTLLSELGLPVVRRYYEACQGDPAVIGLCALSYASSSEGTGANGEIVGWAVGSPHPDQLNARLRQPPVWFAGQMLRLALTHPGVLRQLAASALTSSSQMEAGALELTYIGVASSARGQGMGRELLAAFVVAGRSAGYRSIVLSVETDNPAAIALYTKAGFKITRSFAEGRYQRHRMQFVF